MASHGELKGVQIQPRALVDLSYQAGWQEPLHLHQAVSVWLAESQGYDHAFCDNLDNNGTVASRDCGVCQINIPAAAIGTSRETDLYDPAYCMGVARKLFEARGWQPWVAFNTGVYLHPFYSTRAALGIFNWTLEKAGGVKVPVFTLAELRAKGLWS